MYEQTTKLLDLMDEGFIDPKELVKMCLAYMGENDVADMMRSNDILLDDEDDGQPDEAQEWESFDPDC